MYRNPLNNGDLSDYNSLKNQIDYGARIKKYEKVKLEIEPTELQKYYQYLTYQQPILDELNYVAEKLKNEDIKKQKENFEFIEKLKNQKETQLKGIANKEKNLTRELKNELFDTPTINVDMTPTINTDLEMQINAANKLKANIKARQTERLYNIGVQNIKKIQKEEEELSQLETVDNNDFQVVERKKKGGRPKGSKNTPKRTLNL